MFCTVLSLFSCTCTFTCLYHLCRNIMRIHNMCLYSWSITCLRYCFEQLYLLRLFFVISPRNKLFKIKGGTVPMGPGSGAALESLRYCNCCGCKSASSRRRCIHNASAMSDAGTPNDNEAYAQQMRPVQNSTDLPSITSYYSVMPEQKSKSNQGDRHYQPHIRCP